MAETQAGLSVECGVGTILRGSSMCSNLWREEVGFTSLLASL